MRHALLPSALLASLVLAAPASAQSGSGWVDPPAKPGAVGSKAPERTVPVATGGEGAKNIDTRITEGSPSRAAAVAVPQERRSAAVEAEPAPGSDRRLAGWAGAARRLTVDYLAAISATEAEAIASAPRFFGERVQVNGRLMTLPALLAEKRRLLRQWPERHYAPHGRIAVACNAVGAICLVRTEVAFRTQSPPRNARSSGLTDFVVTVSFAGNHPVVVSESSRVLRRDGPAGDDARRGETGA